MKDEFDKEGALKSMLRKLWLGCLCLCLKVICSTQPQPADVHGTVAPFPRPEGFNSESTESVVSMFPVLSSICHSERAWNLLPLPRAHALIACQVTQEVQFLAKVWLTEQEPWKGAGLQL